MFIGVLINSVPAYISTILLMNGKGKKLSKVLFGFGYVGLALTVVLFADGVRRMYLILKVV